MRLGRDFELLLQELALAPPEGRRFRRGEQRLRDRRGDCFRLRVDEEVFLLDAETKRAGAIRHRPCDDTDLMLGIRPHALPRRMMPPRDDVKFEG